MRYIILKELLPSLKNEPDYDENMNFITKCLCIENDELYVYDTINIILEFLEKEGFVSNENERYINTMIGMTATQIREVHCLVFGKLLNDKMFLELSTEEMICIFSCHTNITVVDEMKTFTPTIALHIIEQMNKMYSHYNNFELRVGADMGIDSTIHYDLMEGIKMWCRATNPMECKMVLFKLYEEKGITLGEFIKAIMKITNIANEIERFAEKTGNMMLLSRMKEIPQMIQKYVAINQSLYI